jgi:hypothetical protein
MARAVLKPKPAERPTLDSIQREAEELDTEFQRAATFGAVPPSTDELRDFFGHVADAVNSECEDCRDNARMGEDFKRAVAGGHYETASEALIDALLGAGFTGIGARDTLEAFVSLALHEHAETWVAEHAADIARRRRIPPCAASMGCLCAGHARGADADAACDTTE